MYIYITLALLYFATWAINEWFFLKKYMAKDLIQNECFTQFF
jgi:hypothetical protein